MAHEILRPLVVAACWLAASMSAAAGENILDLPIGDASRADREIAVTLDGVIDTRAGELITPAELARRLATTRVLFIGEEHTTPEFHDVQLATIKALHDAGREVLIGLEMYPYDQQAPLDQWIDGKLTERGFVDLSGWYVYWSHHWGYYRDIFNYAREQDLRMYGVNMPRAAVNLAREKGFDALDPESRRHLPPKIDLTNAEHRRLFRAYFSDDDALHSQMSEAALDSLYRAQVTWDASMGWNAAQALERHGGKDAIIVIMIGAGHVAYNLGGVRQLAANYSGEVRSLIPVAVRNGDGSAVGPVRASYADFIWGVPGRDGPGLPVLGVSLAGRIGNEPSKVIQVDKDGSAAQAGVRVGDILLRLGDTPITSTTDLQRSTGEYAWGDGVPLEIRRDGVLQTLDLVFRRPTPKQ
ncbi:MAG: ChaN family lipoprotein [Steroidobacteraceae bacterium]|nr:ChaN family lipoprotein [Steroidobacteraceae bacterium]